MGIFSKSKKSETGVYLVESKKLKPLNVLPGSGSINDISESLGYSTEQVHGIFTFDSDKIECIEFKKGTKEPLFILAKNSEVSVVYSDVLLAIEGIDWDFENSML